MSFFSIHWRRQGKHPLHFSAFPQILTDVIRFGFLSPRPLSLPLIQTRKISLIILGSCVLLLLISASGVGHLSLIPLHCHIIYPRFLSQCSSHSFSDSRHTSDPAT
ncbi:hypothetical protein BDW72DRAFT_169164 [Aspergillus terricola var. indicus]